MNELEFARKPCANATKSNQLEHLPCDSIEHRIDKSVLHVVRSAPELFPPPKEAPSGSSQRSISNFVRRRRNLKSQVEIWRGSGIQDTCSALQNWPRFSLQSKQIMSTLTQVLGTASHSTFKASLISCLTTGRVWVGGLQITSLRGILPF